MSNDVLEHQEDIPDQDEIGTQETVDRMALGVTNSSMSPVGTEPDRSREVEAMAVERAAIHDAAIQLARILANSGDTVSKVLQQASQCIMRTVYVPFGGNSEKLLAENFDRSVARIWLPAVSTLAIATTQIVSPFAAATAEFPMNSVQISTTATEIVVWEFRTTDTLWAKCDSAAIAPVAVCILEEFIS
jgi:hypothetical protein